jgi:hypothetical protein
MPSEAESDKRLNFLAAIVEDAGRRTTGVMVNPSEIGQRLDLTPAEVGDFVEHWVSHGRLRWVADDYVAITLEAIETVDEAKEDEVFLELRRKYVESSYPSHRAWSFQPASERNAPVFKRLMAKGLLAYHGLQDQLGSYRLSDLGHARMMGSNTGTSGIAVNIHHGDVVYGSKNTATMDRSNIGAVALGNGASATNTIDDSSGVTQEQLRSAMREAQIALVHDQEALDQIDGRLYEALGQFLRLAREIQVEQKSIAEVQARMKETLDEVWAQQMMKGLKPQAFSQTLEVIQALLKNPITAAIAQHLLSQIG